MKKVLLLLTAICFLIIANAQVPFTKGVNLTEWLQASNVNKINFEKFTKKDFADIKSLGCDVIRLPFNLHGFTKGAPDYVIEPRFLHYLDSAVNWAEELNIYLILDNHSFDPSTNTQPSIENILVKVWPQLAQRYKDRSDYIMYEVLNEPHGIDDAIWNAIQQKAIDAIRSKDTKHTIVIGPASWNSYLNLDKMPVYNDPNLIYTFHFYEPFSFTHQGAGWNTPNMSTLKGVPYPYDASRMPECPANLKGTWVEDALKRYPLQGNAEYIKSQLDIAINFMKSRHVKIFCGEFGALMYNSDNADRVKIYNDTKTYMEANGIAWTSWDYTGSFGLFKKGSDQKFEKDLNVPLLKALGFNVPSNY